MSVSVVSLFLASLFAADARLPKDAALDEVRPRLERVLSAADADQLPTELLTSKIREGLAKRVSAPAIATAVEGIVERWANARKWLLAMNVRNPSSRLLQAVSEAQLAGLQEDDVRPLLKVGAAEEVHTQAIEVLTDLSLRGYDRAEAVPVVQSVLAKDARALPQLAPALELMRRDFALTSSEAAQAVEGGLKAEGRLTAATARARQRAERADAEGKSKGNKSDEGRDRGVQAHPGRGMGKGLGKMK